MNTTDKVHFTGARYLPYFDFWKSHLANYGQGFSFIQKKRHEAYHEGEYKSVSFELDAKLVELAKGNDTGIFVCFLSAFSILFNRYTEERHIVIHSPLNLLNSGGAIYSSEVPLFFEADQRLNLKEYLNKVRTGVKECYNYQNFPVELLNDQVEAGLFLSNILVNYNGLHASTVSRQYDLTIGIENKTDKILIDLKYNTNRFEDYFIASFQKHLKQVFSYFDDLNISLEEIDILPEQEKKLLLSNFNFNTTKSYPNNKTIHRLFEETAVEHPESIAIVFENKQLTYKELNEQSNQLAHYIKEQCGVTKGDLVGLLLDHSEDLIVSILAILKAGAAYVPLDPSYPHHRIKTIIEDATVKVLITNQSKESYSEVSQILFPDIKEELYNYPAADHSKTVEPTDLAYIMYTSGTTGVPKGVVIEHKSVINLIEGLKAEFEPQKEWKYILTSSIAFDASVKQMLLPLTNGSELHIIRDLKDMDGLRNYIGAHNINVMHASPSVWNEMLKGDFEEKICFDSLKCISSGGDKLSQALSNTMFQVFKGNQLRNMYGPTETCINALCYEINATLSEAPPIGKPLPNYQIYILDSVGRLQPAGIMGEIYISGDGLARGYLNHPELTDRKFTVNPFKSGDTIYNTGDLGRWLPDGNIEFIGRKDHQVKIRGNRIELGEIENALLKDADIESTIVVAKEAEDGEKQLIAYYSGKKSLKFADLRNNLEKYLPDYMIPSYFIYLESFPLSPNGKVDLKLLPSELTVNASRHNNPRNELESSLIKIWKRVLRKENICISDNFFELGGHSLKATQIVSAIYKELNSKVQLKSIFSHPTIADLALAIEATRKTEFVKIPVVPIREYYDLSNAQRRLWVLNQLGEEKTAYNIPGAYLITGELNCEAFEKCFETLITRHESLRTSFILVDGEPKQKIHDDPGFKLKYIDLRDEDERETIASRLAEEEANATFDLEKAPLLRAQLIRLEERKYLFLFTMHHIISDGWSMQVLAKEVFSLYNIYIKGLEISLPQLNLQYKDYSVWQKQQLDSEGSAEILAYWQQQLDHPSVLKLPTDYPRPAIKTYRGDTIHHMISADLTSGLKSFCLQHNVSLFMTLLACVKVILYHYTKQEDLIIGSPVAGRNHPDLEDQIGFYVNTLVLRTKLAAQKESFEEILDKVKATTLKAYEYQHYPFDHLLENLNLTRDMSRSPLFDVMVVIQNSDTIESVDMEGIKVANYLNYDSGSKFDLSFYFQEKEENIVLDLEYNKDLFKQERIQLLACEFESMVASVLADKKLPVAELNFRSSYEEGFYEDIKKNTVFEFDF